MPTVHANISNEASATIVPGACSPLQRVVLTRNDEGTQSECSDGGSGVGGSADVVVDLVDNNVDTVNDGEGSRRREQLIRGPRIIKRTTSCPPIRGRSVNSGPWSLEWLKSHNGVGEGGTLISNKKVTINSSSTSGPCANKKKGASYLRHTAQSMRRIARLPAKDREDVLRALKRNVKKRKGLVGDSQAHVLSKADVVKSSNSQPSVNNDWQNWLVLHGIDKVANEDVKELGKELGLKFNGDKNIMFDVLSSVRPKNKEGVGKGK